MRAIWKLQDAKAQFSKIVEYALKQGPQFVTRRGAKAVVVISVKHYEDLVSNKLSFKEFLLNSPKMDEGFELEREKNFPGVSNPPVLG